MNYEQAVAILKEKFDIIETETLVCKDIDFHCSREEEGVWIRNNSDATISSELLEAINFWDKNPELFEEWPTPQLLTDGYMCYIKSYFIKIQIDTRAVKGINYNAVTDEEKEGLRRLFKNISVYYLENVLKDLKEMD